MRDSESTEVKFSEQSKGGLKYELVLSEPNLSKGDIAKKLKAAEERKEDKNILNDEKQTEEQIQNLREKIQKKLEIAQVKRENFFKKIKEKIKEHGRHIDEVRQAPKPVRKDEKFKYCCDA